MTKHIEHSFSQDKMHILMPNTQQIMRDKLADSLKEFHQWSDLIRSGEAEVTSMSIKRKPKTWVGLTDEEIQRIIDLTPNQFTDYMMRFAWNLQEQLKEKNT